MFNLLYYLTSIVLDNVKKAQIIQQIEAKELIIFFYNMIR